MVIIDKCGVRGDATLCVVIFHFDTFKSSFCVLAYFKSPATISYSCITPIIFIRIPILRLCLLWRVIWPINNKIVFNVVERVVLLISTAKYTGTVHTGKTIASDFGAKTVLIITAPLLLYLSYLLAGALGREFSMPLICNCVLYRVIHNIRDHYRM